jgi:hypothetical protein
LRAAFPAFYSPQKEAFVTVLAAPKARPDTFKSFDQLQRHLDEFISRTRPPAPDRKARLRVHGYKVGNTRTNAAANYETIQTINEDLRPYGVQFVANDRVFHIYTEPRRVWVGESCCADASERLYRELYAEIGVKSHTTRSQECPECGKRLDNRRFVLVDDAIGRAWLDDGGAGHALRFLKDQGHDIGAPVWLAKQLIKHRASLKGGRGFKSVARLGGPSSEEQKLFTDNKEKINAEIMRQRDLHTEFARRCDAMENAALKLAKKLCRIIETWDQCSDPGLKHCRVRPLASGLLVPRTNDHNQGVNQAARFVFDPEADDDDAPSPPKRKVWDTGTYGAASKCRQLDPSTSIELREPKKGSAWMRPYAAPNCARWSSTPLDKSKILRPTPARVRLSHPPKT